jgi:elongation of very long chain fatty acids protein 6
MDQAIELWDTYVEQFDENQWVAWTEEHLELPILTCCAYLYMVQSGRQWVPKPWNLKWTLVLWNSFLAIFSIIGTAVTLPHLINKIQTDGLHASMCDDFSYFMKGRPGFFIPLFVYSKFAELIDTALLVVRHREVLFLHWFHHVTVLVFCWLALQRRTSCGFYFGVVNFFVHSIMYSYYALMIAGFRAVVKIARFITALQIFQMVVGMGVIVYVIYAKYHGDVCLTHDAILKLGFAMYFSYFILFGIFYHDKYLVKKEQRQSQGGAAGQCMPDHNDTDAAGLFLKGERNNKKQQ